MALGGDLDSFLQESMPVHKIITSKMKDIFFSIGGYLLVFLA
jgi:hypothetical protein